MNIPPAPLIPSDINHTAAVFSELVNVNDNRIINVADPVEDQDAVNKRYVDDNFSPANPDMAVQFNNNGIFEGTSDFVYDVNTKTLTVENIKVIDKALVIESEVLTSGGDAGITIQTVNNGSTANSDAHGIYIKSADTNTIGKGAAIDIQSGNVTVNSVAGVNGGDLRFESGNAVNTGTGGATGGSFDFLAGDGKTLGGNFVISAGDASSGTGGSITLKTGIGTSNGNLTIAIGSVYYRWPIVSPTIGQSLTFGGTGTGTFGSPFILIWS